MRLNKYDGPKKMSDNLIMRKTQKAINTYYIPGAKNCERPCSVFTDVPPCYKTEGIDDWNYGWMDCGLCAAQKLCAAPSRLEGFIGYDSQNNDPLVSVLWDEEAPNIKCRYNVDKINKYSQLQEFKKKWGSTVPDPIMQAFCGQPVDPKTCPAGLSSCSRLKSTAEGSNECRTWYGNLKDDHARDAINNSYCFRHKTDDCKCVNRSLSSEYNYLKKGNPMNDKCWYVPCANPSRYFIPAELTEGSCPENVCSQVIEIYKNRDVYMYDNDLICNFGTSSSPLFISLERYWAIISLLIILFVIIGIGKS